MPKLDINGKTASFTWQDRDVTPLTVFGLAEIKIGEYIYGSNIVVSRFLLERDKALAGEVILRILEERMARDFAITKNMAS